MHLVTSTKTTVTINDDGKPESDVTVEAHIEDSEEAVDRLLMLKGAGDDRVKSSRVFELTIDDDGIPSLGDELDTE